MTSGSRKLGILVLGIVAGCLLIFSAIPISKAQDQKPRIDEFKKKAQDINREIEKGKAKIQKFSHRETDIIIRLNQVDQALNRSRRRIAGLSREIKALEKKIAETDAASEKLANQISDNEIYVAKRLVALYKLNRLGKFHVLASAESLQELLKRKTAIERILTYDETVIKALMDNRLDLEAARSRLEEHRNEKRRRADEYQKQIKQMQAERRQRAKLLAHIRKEKSAQLAAIESLKLAARDLDDKIKNLDIESAAKTLQKYAAPEPFRAYKGLLKMPVKGKIISLFGKFKNTSYQVLNFRSGIEIQTERGEPIEAVYAGKILYADWFKGYGNMIIIDHGENYYTVYAHIEEAFKSTGDTVETGEVIATVGDSGSISGPKLYFEVRHHGKPLDPKKSST
ncbi:MAG: peptidoglycan DD-metalloendopeptidase family protein [Deltaproteobacteria bacterium]